MDDLTVIAVDWSGAKGTAQRKGIWVAVVRDGALVESRGGLTREEAVAFVAATPGRVVAGFDFSFSVPAWFARAHGCTTIDDVWALAERDGETWLAPTPPFWRTACAVPPEQRFRSCELALHERGFQPKSVFQLVGNGQVGAGSVRGMPLLPRLRDAGFAIWPFDPPGPRLAMEIYPTALAGRKGTNQEDAERAALALWEHRDALRRLEQATDDVTLLEGDVFLPR